jgi:hypothetical protein
LLPQELRATLQQSRRAYAVFALQLTSELFRLLQCCSEAGVEVLVTKGPALSVRCYGDAGMRQYGDLDLIVRQSDVRRVTELMLHLSYEPRVPLAAIDANKIPGEYIFRNPTAHFFVEFHTERTLRYHPRPIQIEKLFNRRDYIAIDAHQVPAPSLEDELILNAVHGTKHFWERLMWIADVAALSCSSRPPDWDRALDLAREQGTERILYLSLRLASDLLGAPLPKQIMSKVQSDRAVSTLAAQIVNRLATNGASPLGVVQRATFRVRMCGDPVSGVAYLLRLSFSPTEEDWVSGDEDNRNSIVETISRPIRLARKHSRRSTE